jgi:excisionase family DNA binding protein
MAKDIRPLTLKELQERPFLTPAEAAATLSVTPTTVHRMIRDGELTRLDLGGKVVRVSGPQLAALVMGTLNPLM